MKNKTNEETKIKFTSQELRIIANRFSMSIENAKKHAEYLIANGSTKESIVWEYR